MTRRKLLGLGLAALSAPLITPPRWARAQAKYPERAIRLMAMARKTWGGNRTVNGARTQQILASVLRTCWQQGKDAFGQFVNLLRSARPILLEIIPAGPSP